MISWGTFWYKVRGHPRGPTDIPQAPPTRLENFDLLVICFEASVEALGSPLGIDKPAQTSPEASREIFFFRIFDPLCHNRCEMEPKSSIFEKVSKSGHVRRFTASRRCHANRRTISLGSVKSQLIWLDGSQVWCATSFYIRSAQFRCGSKCG